MLVEQYFVYQCEACDGTVSLSSADPVTVQTCPNCGTPITGDPQGIVERQHTRGTRGLYECFDCGHSFGYADPGNEHHSVEPNCPKCASDNVSRI